MFLEPIKEFDKHPCNCDSCTLKVKVRTPFGLSTVPLDLGYKCPVTGLYCDPKYEHVQVIYRVGCAAHPLWGTPRGKAGSDHD